MNEEYMLWGLAAALVLSAVTLFVATWTAVGPPYDRPTPDKEQK